MKENRKISLFINSATKATQIGVSDSIKKESFTLDDPKKTLEEALLAVNSVLERLSVRLADVDAFYLLLGPGSNTGIRLGLTIPRTIYAFNNKIQLFGLPTLDLYQMVDKDAVPVLSDRNGNLFIKDEQGTRRIEKDEVSSLDSSLSYVVESADKKAIEELSSYKVIKIDVLDEMMKNVSSFKDYSNKEEEFLPLYTQEI